MIPVPEGWRSLVGSRDMLLSSPQGEAQIRYRERIAPLQPVRALVAAALSGPPEWRTVAVGERERLVTGEGEHAFWVPVRGELLGAPANRCIGVVYGDDFANLVDALVPDPAHWERIARLVRELLHDAALGLGVRRRRYFYRPPAGWRGNALGLVAHWYPPAFPADATTIVVYPANPASQPAEVVFETLLRHEEQRGFTLTALSGPHAVDAAGGMSGKHWQLVGRGPAQLHRDLVVFVERPYVYSVQLDSLGGDVTAARATFLELAASIEAVPAPGAQRALPPGSLDLFTGYA